MAQMHKRHMKMVQRMIAMLKAEPDYETIDEVRILNDGGGTGTWVVAIKPHGKKIRAAHFSIRSIFAEPDRVHPAEYFDLNYEGTEFIG